MDYMAAVREATAAIEKHYELKCEAGVDQALGEVQYQLESLAEAARQIQGQSTVFESYALDLAASALDGWREWEKEPGRLRARLDLVETTLESKHQDYGNAPLIKFGAWGFVIRMDSKLERLKNLLAKMDGPKNESIMDTWLDLVGYAVLLFMFSRDQIR